MDRYEYNTLPEALKALDAAESDCRADFGDEGLEAGWYDLVRAVASYCSPEVAEQLLTSQGLDPLPNLDLRDPR